MSEVAASQVVPPSRGNCGVEDVLDAREMNEIEKTMSLKDAVKKYPKAVMYSVIISSSLIMEGFDLTLLSSFYALPAFKLKFGVEKDGSFEIPSKWQTGLTMCVNCGEILGLQISGYIADRFGYRRTLCFFLTLVFCIIFELFFAPSLAALAVGEVLIGICFGCFQTMAVNYASDICPMALRLYLTTYINICWTIGMLLSSGVVRAKSMDPTEAAYKVPYAIQWIWPLPILIGIYLSPESPWWLVKHGRYDEAKKMCRRILSPEPNEDVEDTLEKQVVYMRLTNEMEELENAGTSYWDCFKGVDLRRTEITVISWLFQNECGNTLMFYSTYFYEQAGLLTTNAFNFSIIQYAFGVIGCLCSWLLIKKLGRFTIFFGGLCLCGTLMFIVGCMGLALKSLDGPKWAAGSLLIVFTFVYDTTLGPICYTIVGEMASTRLRVKTVILARNVYNIGGIFNAIITPYQLNPQSWNWGAKTGFFWAGSCLIGAIWAYFRLPETKNRTFAELGELFNKKVSARKFKKTEVVVFEKNEELILDEKVGVEHKEYQS